MLTVADAKVLEALWHDETTPDDFDGVLSVANRAVELVAARGGTMTDVDLDEMSRNYEGEGPNHFNIRRLLQHITTQGATMATLLAKVAELENERLRLRRKLEMALDERVEANQKRDALSAEVERLNGRVEGLTASLEASLANTEEAESRLAAILERASDGERMRREYLAAYDKDPNWQPYQAAVAACLHLARWLLYGAAPNPLMPSNGSDTMPTAQQHADIQRMTGAEPQDLVETLTITGGMAGELPTMIHQSTRYPCSDTCTHDDAANPGHPERVKERSEAFNAAGICAVEQCERHSAYDMGAEAMRAACLEAVRRVAQTLALGPTEQEMFKAAIEGATL